VNAPSPPVDLHAITGDRGADTAPRRLLSLSDLAQLPPPSWLLEELVPAGGFNVLFGPSGAGKSFLALDWSLCIAAGLSWYGREAKPGWVLYIAAEGVSGLNRRAQAWQHARNQPDVEQIRFLPEAVNLLDRQELHAAQRTLDELPEPPALIVIDTMARTMVGGDENAARDVGMFIAAVDKLAADSGAARIVVHHTGKNGEDERGSSALRGAADMMHALKPEAAELELTCVKAKDSEPYNPWRLHLAQAAESCVLRLGSNGGALSAHERQILQTLPEAFGSDPVAAGLLNRASGVPERSFYRALQSLLQREYVDVEQSGRSKHYRLTALGETALLPTTANYCHGAATITATTATPLGVAGGSQCGSEQPRTEAPA